MKCVQEEFSLLVCAVAAHFRAPVHRVGDAVVIAEADHVVPLLVVSVGRDTQPIDSDRAWCQRFRRFAEQIAKAERLQAYRDRREFLLREWQEELARSLPELARSLPEVAISTDLANRTQKDAQAKRRLEAIARDVSRLNDRQAGILRLKAQRTAQQQRQQARTRARWTKRMSCVVECI